MYPLSSCEGPRSSRSWCIGKRPAPSYSRGWCRRARGVRGAETAKHEQQSYSQHDGPLRGSSSIVGYWAM